jgi:hypothetical protein
MKVSGCDGSTTCGSRLEKNDTDVLIKNGSKPGQIKVEVKNEKLIVTDPEDTFEIATWFKSWFSSEP